MNLTDDILILETESTMNPEARQVLDMLAQGKITADDAARLLDRLHAKPPAPPDPPTASGEAPRAKPKFLRVMVNSEDGDVVNVRVPIKLVSAGMKLSALMPKEVGEKLKEKGIDLSELAGGKGEAMVEAMSELSVDVQSEDGDSVKIFCE